ncbi:MAG: amidohydrolase [Halieaceae bacterium]|jgi:predicted amidohydrolase YtcJ|nr:amidohydrolase [Halieaceae bacterium]
MATEFLRSSLQVRAGLAKLLSRLLLASLFLAGCSDPLNHRDDQQVVIYPAARIITMEPDHAFSEAVATRGGRIVAVGTLATLKTQFSNDGFTLDTTFSDKFILPGFVEPHLHPSLAALILPMHIVAAMEWPTPRGTSIAVRGQKAFLNRLRELDASVQTPWLMVWGYHFPYHGPLSRQILDSISNTRPIMVWQRSVHEMYFNSKALETLELTADMFAGSEHANWEEGHLWETGLFTIGKPMMKLMASPSNYLDGLTMMSQVIHRGGITTVGEQGFPQVNEWLEYWSLWWELGESTPYRFALVPNAMFLLHQHDNNAIAAEEAASRILERGNSKILPVKHMKYYADGAIFSQLMQLSEPYMDGHQGAWMMSQEHRTEVLRTFWDKGWNIHIHVNGDAGLDAVLDEVERQRQTAPDPERRVVLEHYGYARPDQHRRVKALNIAVSNNAYYVHELAPIYAEHGMGSARAKNISPLGGLAQAGVPISFHSDYPMAPAEPLTLAWAAVNRIGSDGNVWGEAQKLPLDIALRAITIEAAWSLGLDHEIGSVKVGKKADFTILEQDPYAINPDDIRHIPIWGTVFEGKHYPLH